jgi:predicted nuclease of predicted toxin-antitoxin system
VGMKATTDSIVWNYAKDNDLMIVSKDMDMHDLSLALGNPPKVIWLRLGNCSTLQVENLLCQNFEAIKLFYIEKSLSLLALS